MRQRTPHRKSRFGCKECKQRHVKCDESRPVCVNCTTALRRCSYLDAGVALPSSCAFLYQCPSPATSTATVGSAPSEPANHHPDYPPTPPYDLRHMELLYHFEHDFASSMGFGDGRTQVKYQQMSMKQAFQTPYLMDELLAISAAHKSTIPGEDKTFYRSEATRLQTRGLTQFNAKAELSNDNFLSIFLYSTWLSQHVLFDTFSVHGNFATLLDKLVHGMNLHRGVRTIVSGSWNMLRAHLNAHLGPDSRFVDSFIIGPDEIESGDECSALIELLDRTELSVSSRAACHEAIEHLQLMFDIQKNTKFSMGRRHSTVQEWSIRVPTEYVNLLDQRRPEALVVLAYWGVLLHKVRDCWAFANAGQVVIESIANHLGSYWGEWLAWPQKVLEV